MKFTIGYCCYANENYVYANLKNHYDYADEIIVSYGPFQDYPKYRELMGLPAEDNTLDIIKDFIKNEDGEHKIKLIIQKDGFKNFTESRNSWLPYVTGDWFCSLDLDEFYYQSQMKLARDTMNLYVDQEVKMIQCNRRSFALNHYCHYDNSWYARLFPIVDKEAQDFIESKSKTLQPPCTAMFKNGLGVFPENGFDLFSVVAYRNDTHISWVENSIDSFLVNRRGEPYFSDLGKVVYEPNIRYNHYGSCENPQEYLAKQLYYHVVRGALSSEDEIAERAQLYKEIIEHNPYVLMVWFENNPGVYFRKLSEPHPPVFEEFVLQNEEVELGPEVEAVLDLDFEERKKFHQRFSA